MVADLEWFEKVAQIFFIKIYHLRWAQVKVKIIFQLGPESMSRHLIPCSSYCCLEIQNFGLFFMISARTAPPKKTWIKNGNTVQRVILKYSYHVLPSGWILDFDFELFELFNISLKKNSSKLTFSSHSTFKITIFSLPWQHFENKAVLIPWSFSKVILGT